MPAFTASQRAKLACLRIRNPRAQISVPARQYELPAVRVRLRWRPVGKSRRKVCIWLLPDGQIDWRASDDYQ